jgi:signal transduction histidine kinase
MTTTAQPSRSRGRSRRLGAVWTGLPGATAERPPPPVPVVLGLAGVGFASALIDLGITDTFYGSLRLFVGVSFIGVGLYSWWRRPGNSIGPLMIATGFLWFTALLTGHTSSAYVFTIAGVVGSLYHATTIHLLLAFPSGRLETPRARLAAVAGYVVIGGGNLLIYLLADFQTDFACPTCPENVLQVVHNSALAETAITVVNLLAAVLVAWVVVLLIANWRRSQGWRRSALTPLLVAAAASAFLLGLTFLVLAFDEHVASDVFTAATAAFALVPYAFLLGLVRSAMLGRGGVADLAARLADSHSSIEAREALRVALGDPSLEWAFRAPAGEHYVNPEGRRIALPGPGDERACALADHDGRPVAAIVYDAAVVDDPQLVEAVRRAAALAIEKHLLDAELALRVEELRASRERILEIAQDERRRLERDLHDGAQQQLVSLALELRMAQAALDDDSEAHELLEGTASRLDVALGELRDLARGLHPAVLSDQGLGAALASLAGRTPFDVRVDGVPAERLPEKVELAVYFLVSEALANAVKHSHASRATVTMDREGADITVEISDDGIGGADASAGSGLRGLADRLAVLDGGLEILSPPGGGTTVRAWIPCE